MTLRFEHFREPKRVSLVSLHYSVYLSKPNSAVFELESGRYLMLLVDRALSK